MGSGSTNIINGQLTRPFQDTPHVIKGALKKRSIPANDLFTSKDFAFEPTSQIDAELQKNNSYGVRNQHEIQNLSAVPKDRQNLYLRNWVINNIKTGETQIG